MLNLDEYIKKQEIYKYGIGELYDGTVDERTTLEKSEESIFDDGSYNYHLYPEKKLETFINQYEQKYEALTNAVLDLEKNGSITVVKSWGDFDSKSKEDKDKIYIWMKSKGKLKKADNIFYFMSAIKNDVVYNLNLMRFFISKEKNNVNCILYQFQYDRVNEDKNKKPRYRRINSKKVCYPTTSENQSLDDLSTIAGKGNFCYNPPIAWNTDADVILKDFINFVCKCEGLPIDEFTES